MKQKWIYAAGVICLAIAGTVIQKISQHGKFVPAPIMAVAEAQEDVSARAKEDGLITEDSLQNAGTDLSDTVVIPQNEIRDGSDTPVFPPYDPLNDPRDPLKYRLENNRYPSGYPPVHPSPTTPLVHPMTYPTPLRNNISPALPPVSVPPRLSEDPLRHKLNP